MPRKFFSIILVVTVLLGGSFVLGMCVYFFSDFGRSGIINKSGEIGLVKIEGGIFDPKDALKELNEYRKDDDIKAVILRIDSPGGTVAASQEIYNAVRRLADKKPVVASMGSIAASGGYYVALGATKILANPGTITGSIGVRMEHVEIGELLRWAKINHETLKSGKFKDIASTDRPMTDEERAILETMLEDIHRQFKEVLLQRRGLAPQAVEEIADGRIYSGEQAKKLGLIDELGGIDDAALMAAGLAHIKGEPEVVEKYKHKNWFIEKFVEGMFSQLKSSMIASGADLPLFLYLAH